MNQIVSFQGGMAGGKTTLAKRLEKKFPNIYVSYENPYPLVAQRGKLDLDLSTEEGFVNNQRLFIRAEIERFLKLPTGKVLFDRGPEDIEFFTLHYPRANGFEWDIEYLLKEELTELRSCRSDLIIYLDASPSTLFSRKIADQTRERGSFDKNMKLYPFEREWYEKQHTVFIQTNEKSADEIELTTLNLLKEIDFV
ncbi:MULTISPECIES: AAA family ATPase [unclassified Bacillus (in: firmicutes)]|uniref:AAA family ATPase n=1 Tax=unclassified Bacillus (in: firmicutes) TaxID=185979 RepID=UPI0008E7F8C8|nr:MULTISPECIES: AAA family ATPase [unclassified Bacillus (in: firmicutes)]SFA70993.1 Uridine kinase [Bacillus sp. UNCCL13]SFQ61026.1 Uridine kinase [Bacillus sp. cl95]